MSSIDIIQEVQQNFIDSSYDVNTNRAFPDIRDGLKPGQRACLWEMYTKKYNSKKPHVKSAKISGGVAALWWPHGTTAIYETFARMSQPFVNNIPEVDFHGANGNIILGGDAIAADRYCMTGDTLIKTNLGTIKLKDISKYTDENEVVTGINIFDYRYNEVPATKFFDCGEHTVLGITFKNGLFLKVTPNHPLLCTEDDGSFVWKKAEDLKINDKVLTVMPKINFDKKEKDKVGVWAKALGCLVSEGYLTTQNRVGINNTDIDMITPVKEWFTLLNNKIRANINYNKKRGYYEYCVASKIIQDILINDYNYYKKAEDKVVPDKILQGTIYEKSVFLSYLFEGDGSVGSYDRTNRVAYSTYSKRMANQIQILLCQDFGIFSSICSSKRKTGTEYKVIISSYSLLRFAEYINFISERKRAILKDICLKFYKIANNSYLTWPEVNNWIHSKIGNNNINVGNVTNLPKVKEKLDPFNYERIEYLFNNYALVSISNIDRSLPKEKVYSVRVDNKNSEHSYIAGGFINHNTEARLSSIVEEGMLKGVEKDTVPMILNFSEDEKWPKVLPAVFPRLLVNGAQGIGVSLSNYWGLHNFTETAQVIEKYLEHGTVDNENYYPDFPTGGIVVNKNDLPQINKTGKGKIIIESKYIINGQEINFYELPYQIYIEPVIDEIKKAIEEEKIAGIEEIFNKSDKKRISLVITVTNGFEPKKVVEQLFQETNLRKQINVNQNGIISKTPIMINLAKYLEVYKNHNIDCIKKEIIFDIKKLQDRIEILEGLSKALEDIDNVIKIIKESKNSTEAKSNLVEKYDLTESQVNAILNMKLNRLANMERIAINNELQEKKEKCLELEGVLESEDKQIDILKNRLRELVKKFGDKRRTEIVQKDIIKSNSKKAKEQIIEDVVITFNQKGYIKSIPVKMYRKSSNDIFAFKARTDEMILLFSTLGKCYRLKVSEIKQCGVKDKGSAIGSILKLDNNESILYITSMNIDDKHPFITFVSKNGKIKKSDKSIYFGSTQTTKGILAAKLKEKDVFISIAETNGDYIKIFSNSNRVIQFKINEEVKISGKNASGVIGIKLDKDSFVKKVIFSTTLDKKIPLTHRGAIGAKYAKSI